MLKGVKMLRSTVWIFVALLTTSSLRADDWPQWLGPQRDGVWLEDVGSTNGTTVVQGSLTGGTPSTTYTIEFFNKYLR